MSFYEFVKNYMEINECKENLKYSNVGHSFRWDREELEGLYWFYQSDDFIIDIHDFYLKEDLLTNDTHSMAEYISIYTAYLISANGEKFNPYQTLVPGSLYTLDFNDMENSPGFFMHKNSYYLGVAIGYKREVLERHLSSLKVDIDSFYSNLFLNNETILAKSLEPVAHSILNCKMESPAAEIFFKAKAEEWISIIIDTFLKRKNFTISKTDEEIIETVARYLEDHFAMDIRQEILEKISMMSGTKLKRLFKEKYHQTITEYTQRKRMNMAEILLINTNLSIREIAESVGYSSHSKFSTYYKRYKGKYPNEIRKLAKGEAI